MGGKFLLWSGKMLPDNGKKIKVRYNYHMSLEELKILLNHLREHYDIKWFLIVILQFCLGLRASEVLAIQIWDFKDHFNYLNYRSAKTNKLIYDEPIMEPLKNLLIAYITNNLHRLEDGYLFPVYTGKRRKGKFLTTISYLASWSKWRKTIGQEYPRFLDHYIIGNQKRYRISSHSLRRLHRTILKNNIQDLYIVKELCNYSDYKTLERYINEQEIIERKENYLLPIFTPLAKQLMMLGQGQKQLKAFGG